MTRNTWPAHFRLFKFLWYELSQTVTWSNSAECNSFTTVRYRRQHCLHELPTSLVCRAILRIFLPGAPRCVQTTFVRDRSPTASLTSAIPQEHAGLHHTEQRIPCHRKKTEFKNLRTGDKFKSCTPPFSVGILGCNAVWTCRWTLTCQRNLLPTSSRSIMHRPNPYAGKVYCIIIIFFCGAFTAESCKNALNSFVLFL
jgi:hypothetical protein